MKAARSSVSTVSILPRTGGSDQRAGGGGGRPGSRLAHHGPRRTRTHGERTPNAGPEPRRRIPSVDALLRSEPGRRATGTFGRPLVKHALSVTLEQVREAAEEGALPPPEDEILARALALASGTATGLVRVINATGVVLHTGLGRAPLPERAAAARGARRAGLRRSRGRSRVRGPRSAFDARGATAHLDDRRRGRVGREQRGRGPAARPRVAGARQGRPGLARRADRDRRRVPDPRHHGGVGRAARRGRHDEPDASLRLPFGADRQDRADPQGASQQLPRRGVRLDAERQGPGRDRAQGGRPLRVRPGFGPARTRPGRHGGRAERGRRARGRGRSHRVLGRQAARRAAGGDRARTRRAGRASPAPPDRAGRARRQDAGGRARVRPGAARPRPGFGAPRVDDAPRAAGARAAPRATSSRWRSTASSRART